MSNILRRDVLRSKLQMAKKALVRYNVAEGEEEKGIIWKRVTQRNEQGQETGVICEECPAESLIPKEAYYSGRTKKIE